jgi:hypothetical protein
MVRRQQVSKDARFQEFLRRLAEAPPASSYVTAYDLIASTLNGVEDELSEISYAPSQWRTDGRMYPPLEDNIHRVQNRPDVRLLRSKGHLTYIRENGAFEIRIRNAPLGIDEIEIAKPGADGRGVWNR